MPQPDAATLKALREAGLIDDGSCFELLTGGVSSDIWKVEDGSRSFCVKRALAKLKVSADWHAPVERNRFEVIWYRIAGEVLPGCAPRVLYHDDAAMLCAMEYLDPATHALWKDKLRAGDALPEDAAAVGRDLAAIHAGTAGSDEIVARFPRQDIFRAIRLEPYLEATAARHPDLKDALFGLSRHTAATRLAMVHGDVSPKNIMIGPGGPVFLDAECACYGDPAFDLAFCLNHFLLKCLWVPEVQPAFLACFGAMAEAYLAGVTWEGAARLEARAASLLPALFLARIDGKSPVEYITDEGDRDRVRRCARRLLQVPPDTLAAVSSAWKQELRA